MKYTLDEAFQFSNEGKIDVWVQKFLRNNEEKFANPNIALADGILLEERFFYGPIEISLDMITPIRVEENIEGNELDYYNKIVERMNSDFNGTNFPPLILEFKDDKLFLTDGSHRFSTLRKKGLNKYYAIIWGNKELENVIKKKYAIIKTRR